MRAIKIDATNRTIQEFDLPSQEGEQLAAMQKVVGGYICHAGEINGDDLYVNDEGLLGISVGAPFFEIGLHQPFAGNGLIVGHNDEGDTTPATVSLDEVKRRTSFKVLAFGGTLLPA